MDSTRYADLKELHHAKEGKTIQERESIEKIMYNIQRQDTPDLNRARQELVGAARTGDGKISRRLSEKIKHMTHKKGMEHHG